MQGCGTGLVGIALACSGASVTLSDLPHIIGLTEENVARNCGGSLAAPLVVPHVWGDRGTVAAFGPRPDLVVCADVLYSPGFYQDLLWTLEALCAPHTLVYIASRRRHVDEECFPELAQARGFAVEQLPSELMPAEFRECGAYFVLRLCRLEGEVLAAG